jgi:thiazole synthase
LGLDTRKVAVERNLEIVPRDRYAEIPVQEGDAFEIVHFIGGGMEEARQEIADSWQVGGHRFHSRLLVGTGKYRSMDETKRAIEASGAEIVTVAVRRVNLSNAAEPMIQDVLDPARYTYLPNTAGCYTAEEAVRTLRLSRELGGWNLVKLEVIGDRHTLYPSVVETLKAAEMLVKDGFEVMAYTTDDPVVAKELEQRGCVAVMPLAAPIGSGLGILNPVNLRIIIEQAQVPVLVDAGIGTASDAALAMEMGCAGVLLNTAIADARDPIRMARAMKAAVEAGRDAFLAGRMPKRELAQPSSPAAGMMDATVTSRKVI